MLSIYQSSVVSQILDFTILSFDHMTGENREFRFRQSTTNRYRSIPIYISIGIDNRYQSITTQIFVIDWLSLININRLIDIDWYRLISIIIDC